MWLQTGIYRAIAGASIRPLIRTRVLLVPHPYSIGQVSALQFKKHISCTRLLNKLDEHQSFKVTQDKTEESKTPSEKETSDLLKTSPKAILKDDIYTIPNILTMSRIVATPLIGYYICTGQSTLAMSLFTYACITDFLDGFIARAFNMKSILGTILDPIADKLLMGICTIALSVVHTMPTAMAAIIIGKDFMLAMMGVYYRYVTLPAPKTFNRLINLGIPTVRVEPNLLSKVNTGLQMVYIIGLVFQTQLEPIISNYDFYLNNYELLVGATTILSGMSYVFSSKSIKKII